MAQDFFGTALRLLVDRLISDFNLPLVERNKIKMLKFATQDLFRNQTTGFKSRLVLVLFRVASKAKGLPNVLAIVPRVIYQICVEYVLGVEIPWDTRIGPGLQLHHGTGLVVNHDTQIGRNCTLRHCTTIGNKQRADGSYTDSPIIGNDVDIGSNSVILGAITIGDGAVIGAGSIVVKDVPAGCIVAGNPAKIVRFATDSKA